MELKRPFLSQYYDAILIDFFFDPIWSTSKSKKIECLSCINRVAVVKAWQQTLFCRM